MWLRSRWRDKFWAISGGSRYRYAVIFSFESAFGVIMSVAYRKVPPEGGWGLLVGIGMAAMFTVSLGSLPSFGLMFGDFLTALGEETGAIALITSCFFSALSFAGLFTNTLMKKYSCRTVGLLGAFSYVIGSFLTIFVRSTNELLISFSVFQGRWVFLKK